jgi:hypothetical protein
VSEAIDEVASEVAKPGEPLHERVLRFLKNLGPGQSRVLPRTMHPVYRHIPLPARRLDARHYVESAQPFSGVRRQLHFMPRLVALASVFDRVPTSAL